MSDFDNIDSDGRCKSCTKIPFTESCVVCDKMKIEHNKLCTKAMSLEGSGEYTQAIECFGEILRYKIDNSSAYFIRGMCKMKILSYEEAFNDFTTAITYNSQYASAYHQRGEIYHAQGRLNEAIEEYNKAIQIKAAEENYLCRGVVYSELKDLEKAESDFRKVIEIGNMLASEGHCNMGNVYLLRVDLAFTRFDPESVKEMSIQAIEHYDIANKLDKGYGAVYIGKCCALVNLKKYNEALVCGLQGIRLNPKSSKAFYNTGRALLGLKQYSNAMKILQRGIELNSKDSACRYILGNVYEEVHMFEKAIESYTKSLEFDPTYFYSYVHRGLVHLRLLKFESAYEDFTKAITQKQDCFEAYNNRGVVLTRGFGKHSEALRDFQRAIHFSPNFENPDPRKSIALCNIADYFAEILEFEESEMYYKKAMETQPSNPDVYYMRYMRHSRVSFDLERAAEDFARVIRLGGNFRGEMSENDIEEMYEKLRDRKIGDEEEEDDEKKYCFHFLEDKMKDKEVEEKEFVMLQEKLQNVTVERLLAYRLIGKGSFGRVYLSRILGVDGIFVLKVCTHFDDEEEKMERMMKSENMNTLSYHRNIAVSNLSLPQIKKIDLRKLPDFEKFWKEDVYEEEFVVRTGIVLMRYYRKD